MGRYLGPKCRISRREGEDLGFKIRAKGRKNVPGEHGGSRKPRLSDYGVQFREKQKLKRTYGLRERQFKIIYKNAQSMEGSTGDNLLILLESRLDNIVYRMGFAATRNEARQMVSHKSIQINGKVNNIPSYKVKPGEEISFVEKAKNQERIKVAIEAAKQRQDVSWIEIDTANLRGVFKSTPEIADIVGNVNVNLIIELYSK
ncbi:MAG: 30S ribosomal protein S4 [Legionellales bacterium]|nr:MAG: 30S ribosomal protein S4 [Legionellales bacterium]